MANWQKFDGQDHEIIKRSASLLLSKGIDIEEEGKNVEMLILISVFISSEENWETVQWFELCVP